MSDHRNANTSPRRHPVAEAISRNVPRHHGPTAHSTMWSCSDGSSASPTRFFIFGRSLCVTGLVVTSPHLIARRYAEDTRPAMLRTVFGDIGRGVLVLRVWPPDFSNRTHSLLRCSGVPALAHEAQAVNAIKRNQRFTVVVGNPPYSKSMSKHPWSLALVDNFKAGVDEKKSDLNREEWKFLSFGYHSIDCALAGIIGMVINNAFLSAPTHRGIRRFLLERSAQLNVVDLHGDSRKGEESPDKSLDENVFDIQQGVCVVLGVKSPGTQRLSELGKADIYGSRERKYEQLSAYSILSTEFSCFSPTPPLFFFRRSPSSHTHFYGAWIPISEIFLNSNTGIQTKNDDLFTDISPLALRHRMTEVLDNVVTNRVSICDKYGLKDSAGWRVSQLNEVRFDSAAVQPFLYKPFDHRFIYYNTRALGRARYSTMQHMLQPNLGLLTTRQVTRLPFCHAFVSRWPIEEKTGSHDRTTQLFPLYIYPDSGKFDFGRQPLRAHSAISPAFSSALSKLLGLKVGEQDSERGTNVISPEETFYYIYSILQSPSYRERFGHELMGDFPRLPLTGNLELFRALAQLGGDLVSLHLLESARIDRPITSFTGQPNPEVEKISHARDAVWLDKAQVCGFRGVTEAVWNFHIGGYKSARNGSRTARAARSPRMTSPTTTRSLSPCQKRFG